MIANPTGGTEVTSQITGGQDPNHRNSGAITLTLTPRLGQLADVVAARTQDCVRGYPLERGRLADVRGRR